MKHFTKKANKQNLQNKLFLCVYIDNQAQITAVKTMGYAKQLDVNNLLIS